MANVARWYVDPLTSATPFASAFSNYCSGAGINNLIGSQTRVLARTKTSTATFAPTMPGAAGRAAGNYGGAGFISGPLAAGPLTTSLVWNMRALVNNPSNGSSGWYVSVGFVSSALAYRGQVMTATGPTSSPGTNLVMSALNPPSAFNIQEGDRLVVIFGAYWNVSGTMPGWSWNVVTNTANGDLAGTSNTSLNAYFEFEGYTAPSSTARLESTPELTPAGGAAFASGKAFSYELKSSHRSVGLNPTLAGLDYEALDIARASLNTATFDQLSANVSGLLISDSQSTPPTFGSFTPAAGAVSATQSISVTVTDSDGIASVTVSVDFPALDRSETVYKAGAFCEGYEASTDTIVMSGDKLTSIAFAIVRTPGWPSAFTVDAEAIDAKGASAETSSAYTLASTEVPYLANVSPASGSTLYAGSIVSFDVLDATSLLRVYIKVVYPDGTEEPIWFGTNFSGQFAQSTQSAIAGGYHFEVQRVGGWQQAPQIYIDPIDTEGHIP